VKNWGKSGKGKLEENRGLGANFSSLFAGDILACAPDQSCSRKLKNKILHSQGKKNKIWAWFGCPQAKKESTNL